MREWLEGLEPRERLLVMGGAGLLIAFLLFVLIWLPVRAGYNNLKAGVAEQRDTAARSNWQLSSAVVDRHRPDWGGDHCSR
jgi:type II secretory pathway component PulM